ncbi:MAG TPA: hypothetical protein VGH20_17365 [Myxococcales bacterium]|jgi:hypothetical protein
MKRGLGIVLALTACAKSPSIPMPDAGTPAGPPSVAEVDPEPGAADSTAHFTVTFTAPMAEGQLLAGTGRSETVVLATAAQVEQVAAAIAHDSLTAVERALLVPTAAQIGEGHASLTLLPDAPLAAGTYYLLVSPRLKDDAGDKLQGNGARFEFEVAPAKAHATLLFPAPGAQAPLNLQMVRASAAQGTVALVAADGSVLASAPANGAVGLQVTSPLASGAGYWLSLDGAVDAAQGFTVSACPRTTPPSLQNGAVSLSVRDTSLVASFALDWPAETTLQIGLASDGEPCAKGACLSVSAAVTCAPDPCAAQAFVCPGSIAAAGLAPATDYVARIVATDDFGNTLRSAVQSFATLAPLPNLIISEVMATPASPETTAEYVELFNLGPGSAVLDGMGFMTADGIVRPLSATAPPTPVVLRPGERALATGTAFDPARYPSLPAQVPILRASTQRLLSHGLGDAAPQAFQLVSAGGVILSGFPGGSFPCAVNESLQRDETAQPGAAASFHCGPDGGTPGAPP